MVATPSLKRDLDARGFFNLRYWGRGVDLELFHPRAEKKLDYPGPLMLYVGRVAVEKNIEAFLEMNVEGTKIVVGDGPQRAELEGRYPDVKFLGLKEGQDLAEIYASCDVFVFPSKTDTFGIVLLEALASGLPVAAYPVMGPLDVIGDSGVGSLKEDLAEAVTEALKIDPAGHALPMPGAIAGRRAPISSCPISPNSTMIEGRAGASEAAKQQRLPRSFLVFDMSGWRRARPS